MKNKLTKNQAAYKKEINRLKDGLRKAEKRGFLPDYNLIPQMPERVTKKALEEIKKLKPRNIYIKGEWVDFETGEVISAHQRIYKGRPTYPDYEFTETSVSDYVAGKLADQLEDMFPEVTWDLTNLSELAKRPVIDFISYGDLSESIIGNLRAEMNELLPGKLADLMNLWLDMVIDKVGLEETAETIQAMNKTFRNFIDESVGDIYEAIRNFQDAFWEELKTVLGEEGAGWYEDIQEELLYGYGDDSI